VEPARGQIFLRRRNSVSSIATVTGFYALTRCIPGSLQVRRRVANARIARHAGHQTQTLITSTNRLCDITP
jgi:hypothetical protein